VSFYPSMRAADGRGVFYPSVKGADRGEFLFHQSKQLMGGELFIHYPSVRAGYGGGVFYPSVKGADRGEFIFHQSKQLMDGSSLFISQGCCWRVVICPTVRVFMEGG
jgi:hypothetical protein